MIGGLIASFMAINGKYEDAIKIGLLIGFIGAFLSFLLCLGEYSQQGIASLSGGLLGYSIKPMVLSTIGSLMGVYIKKRKDEI